MMAALLGQSASAFALTLPLAVEAGWSDEQWQARLRGADRGGRAHHAPSPAAGGPTGRL